MKLAHITPTKYIKRFGSQGDFILALSHLISLEEENEYEKAIKETKLPIILDNGLFENHVPELLETLITKAAKIGAHTFFAPDILYHAGQTELELIRAIAFNKYMETKMSVGVVVQARSEEEYKEQLLKFNGPSFDVGLIGLSILAIPKCFGGKITTSRIELMKWMVDYKESNPGFEWKNMHLLGLGDSYKDVLYATKHCPWIISNDTSSCFQSGINGRRLTDEFVVPKGKVKEKVDFNLGKLSEQQEDEVEYNINKINKEIKKYDH